MCRQAKYLVHLTPKPHKTTRKKWQVIVMGDSLPWGTQAPICRLNQQPKEVCCLPGARIWDVVGLIWPSDYYSLLLFHVDKNDTASGNLDSIKSDYTALAGSSQGHGGSGGMLLIRKHFFTEGD